MSQATTSLPKIAGIVPVPRLPKVVAFWPNIGPYHRARIKVLSRIYDTTAIQLARTQRLAGWEDDCGEWQTRELTLSEDTWEELSQLSVSTKLWRAMSKLSPDVVLVPGHGTLVSFAAAFWSKFYSARTILMSVSTYQDRPRKRWKEFIKGVLLKMFFDIALASGSRCAAYLESLGFHKEDIVAGSNVVDNEFYWRGVSHIRATAHPEDFGLPRHYILYVGRLIQVKNLDRLIRSFIVYREQGGVCDLVLVGDGPLREYLHNVAASRDAGRYVHFVGRQGKDDLLPYYSFADCLTLPSISETWGLVVNEAMASGLPVVVSNYCGCVPELPRHEVNGFVFDPLNEAELVKCLQRIDEMGKVGRQRAGSQSREIISEFSLERWASQVQCTIETLAVRTSLT